MVFGRSRKCVSPADVPPPGKEAELGERMCSEDSQLSQFSSMSETLACPDPVADWVEHHAAAALQQPPQDADESTDSNDSCCSSPPEQLHDISAAGWPRCDAAHPAEEPLHGHSRYSKVRDISRQASEPSPWPLQSRPSFVQLAADAATGQQVAIKFLQRHSLDAAATLREVQHQRACAGHPNIVQLLDVFVTPRHLAIVMEHCNGGDLANLISKRLRHGKRGLREETARYYFQQLVVALDYCHSLGIALRDIKVDNMLLHWAEGAQRPVLKLCDFGYSRFQAVACSTGCGTPEYMAPEVLYGAEYCGQAADVWAAGVSLYVLLQGGFPFTRPGDDGQPPQKALQSMFLRIVAGRYAPVPHLSPEVRHLLHGMLQPDPADRLPLEDLLAHPWFLQGLSPRLRGVNAALLCSSACSGGGGDDFSYRLSDRALTQLVSGAAAGSTSRRRSQEQRWNCSSCC